MRRLWLLVIVCWSTEAWADWVLSATVCSSKGLDTALISNESTTRRLYVGQNLPGESTQLIEVGPKYAIIEVNGVQRTVRLGLPLSVVGFEGELSTSPARQTEDALSLSNQLSRFELASAIDVQWYARSGRARGLMVSPGANRDWFDNLPLQAGDVITHISGRQISERSLAIELWNELKQKDAGALSIYRQGQSLALEVDLRLAL